MDDGQAIGLRRIVHRFVRRRVLEAALVVGGAARERVAAAGLEERLDVGARRAHRRREIRDRDGVVRTLAHAARRRRIAERAADIGGIVGEKMGDVVKRQGSPAEHVHRVMRAHHDAVVAVFGRARDHLLVALGHQQREDERFRISVGRVAARIGRAVGEILVGAAQPVEAVRGPAEIIRAAKGGQHRLGLEGAGIAVGVRALAAGRPVIGLAEDVICSAGREEFRRHRFRDRLLAVLRAVGKEILAGVRVRLGRRIRVGNEIGDGFRDIRKGLPVHIGGLRLIDLAEFRSEPVGELRRIAVGDETVLQGELLLVLERQQEGLLDLAGLDAAGDGKIGRERRLAFRRLEKDRDRRQAVERLHVRRGLGMGLARSEHAESDGQDVRGSCHGMNPFNVAGESAARLPLESTSSYQADEGPATAIVGRHSIPHDPAD